MHRDSDDGDAQENAGDFTLEDLLRARGRNVDPEGRRIDRPEDGLKGATGADYTLREWRVMEGLFINRNSHETPQTAGIS